MKTVIVELSYRIPLKVTDKTINALSKSVFVPEDDDGFSLWNSKIDTDEIEYVTLREDLCEKAIKKLLEDRVSKYFENEYFDFDVLIPKNIGEDE